MSRFVQPVAGQSVQRDMALEVLGAALDAVDPAEAIRRAVRRDGDVLYVAGQHYDLSRYERVLVIGGGKAGAPMAAAIEAILGDRIVDGIVNVKYGYTAPASRITIHEAGHPVPDEEGMAGTQRMVALARGAGADDLVLCLISGGGSALMTLPVDGVTLEDVQVLTNDLLRSGAPIQAINAVRKHLSQVKGGQLARLAHPATVLALLVSDVVGSPLDAIASGPTVPDPTTFADARDVIRHYGLVDRVPDAIRRYLDEGVAGRAPETPKAGDDALERVQTVIVADNAKAAGAAVERAKTLGMNGLLLSTYVEGEAREVARVVAALAREIRASGQPLRVPACVILGGETTVTVRGSGKGGRNQELALAAALAIEGMEGVLIASLATDGSDGPTDSAGGLVDGATVARGAAQSLSARKALDDNDAYPYLNATGDLLVTGPTNTNVNDLMAVFVFEAGNITRA